MSVFTPVEEELVRKYCAGHLEPHVIDAVIHKGEFVELDFSPIGYFNTVRHSLLPAGEHFTISDVDTVGRGGGVLCGFLVIIMDQELTIECFGYDGSIGQAERADLVLLGEDDSPESRPEAAGHRRCAPTRRGFGKVRHALGKFFGYG